MALALAADSGRQEILCILCILAARLHSSSTGPAFQPHGAWIVTARSLHSTCTRRSFNFIVAAESLQLVRPATETEMSGHCNHCTQGASRWICQIVGIDSVAPESTFQLCSVFASAVQCICRPCALYLQAQVQCICWSCAKYLQALRSVFVRPVQRISRACAVYLPTQCSVFACLVQCIGRPCFVYLQVLCSVFADNVSL